MTRAGLCPRNDESAGKRRGTRVRKSGTWLKTTLVAAAWAAVARQDQLPARPVPAHHGPTRREESHPGDAHGRLLHARRWGQYADLDAITFNRTIPTRPCVDFSSALPTSAVSSRR